jgi:hypothetical protein
MVALLASLGCVSSASAYRGDNQAHVVIDPETGDLTPEGQQWVRNIDPEIEQQLIRQAPSEATGRATFRRFVRIIGEKMIPAAGRVVPPVAGVITV